MRAVAGPLPPPPGAEGEWAYELKGDGVRAVAYTRRSTGQQTLRLMSRTDQDMTSLAGKVLVQPETRFVGGDGDGVGLLAFGEDLHQ